MALKLSVVDIWLIPLGHFKSKVNIAAETEGNNLFGMEASARSWNYIKAINHSLTEMAVVILNNEKIIHYLENR